MQDINIEILHNLKTNGFSVGHVIIREFQEINYFCSIIKNVVHLAGERIFLRLSEFQNLTPPRSLNKIAYRKLLHLHLMMKTTIF